MGKIVTVTGDDIRLGTREDCAKCPIARAVKRQFNEMNVQVYSRTVLIDGQRKWLSRSARRFITNFDKKKPVKPFRFILDI